MIDLLLYYILSGIIFGGFSAYIAKEKKRDIYLWFFLGFLFSIIALIAVAAIPSKDEKINSGKKVVKVEKKEKLQDKSIRKTINPRNIIFIIVPLFIFGLAILFLAGVFDQPTPPLATQQIPNDEIHKGADLSQLQEINRLRELVTNNPADHESILHLAHLLNDSGFKEEAIKWYRQYLRDHGDVADVWVDMGVCYFDMNDFDNAISSMKKGIELNPQHQIAHFNLGIVNYTMGNINEAVDWWNKAIELNPTSDIANRARELINTNTNF